MESDASLPGATASRNSVVSKHLIYLRTDLFRLCGHRFLIVNLIVVIRETQSCDKASNISCEIVHLSIYHVFHS